ncbi:MAG: carboxymuconolactone decarboxylase family protein [Phycisphaeraceae bacterium]|nr:carboxymuconolactone decarboxylase family protein [Phycisphaeraceae bacterium]
MAHARMNYPKVAPEPFASLRAINAWLDAADIDPRLRSLIEMRVSQMNGCAFCLDIHAREARDRGVPQQVLDVLPAWKEAPLLFSDAERAALEWAESVTRIESGGVPQDHFDALSARFSESQIAAMTWAVIAMNSWNRLAVAFFMNPRPRHDPGQSR